MGLFSKLLGLDKRDAAVTEKAAKTPPKSTKSLGTSGSNASLIEAYSAIGIDASVFTASKVLRDARKLAKQFADDEFKELGKPESRSCTLNPLTKSGKAPKAVAKGQAVFDLPEGRSIVCNIRYLADGSVLDAQLHEWGGPECCHRIQRVDGELKDVAGGHEDAAVDGTLVEYGDDIHEKILTAAKNPLPPSLRFDVPFPFADTKGVSEAERPFYQDDSYYTDSSYPGTIMEKRVVPFESRKAVSYPSGNGLYVAEILMLYYCALGTYPHPRNGYPGLWWFGYGVRNVGLLLESLESRGFIALRPAADSLGSLKVSQLKELLESQGVPSTGKKADLIARIAAEVSEDVIAAAGVERKYGLTELGAAELLENEYVPYMHNHPSKTIEGPSFGKEFTVWSANRLLHDEGMDGWKEKLKAMRN